MTDKEFESEKKCTFFDLPQSNIEDADFFIIGVPSDLSSTQDSGLTEEAPDIIRENSIDVSMATEDLEDINILNLYDEGNITGSTIENLKEISDVEYSGMLHKNPNIIPVTIGGNHLITFPVFRAILLYHQKRSTNKDIYFTSFDAHIDFYDDWEGDSYSHCTVTKRIFELGGMGPQKTMVIGCRDIDLPELELAKTNKLKFFTMAQIREKLRKGNHSIPDIVETYVESQINKNDLMNAKPKMYVSIDIDALDPSVAPATGYPIPGGFTYPEMLEILKSLSRKFDIIGFDLVEYAPNLDFSNKMTAFLCTKLIVEFMMYIKLQKVADLKQGA